MKKAYIAILCAVVLLAGAMAGYFVRDIVSDTGSVTSNSVESEDIYDQTTDVSSLTASPSSKVSSDENLAVLSLGYQAAKYIKARDYSSLSSMIHPDYGVLFVPYSTVDFNKNQNFTPAEVKEFGRDTSKYVWGVKDGDGSPISLTASEYFDTYVFNVDYTKAPSVAVNAIIKTGNSLENLTDSFPDAQFVDFTYPSIDDANEGFDWCSLKIVFEPYNGVYKIVAVIHSQWTI